MPEPAATQHDEQTGELLDVYTGDTLEEALAEAVAVLGLGLEVRRARKVRSGVRGLMGKPFYEVLAVSRRPVSPPPAQEEEVLDADDVLQEAVARLLAQADQREVDDTPAATPKGAPTGAAAGAPAGTPVPRHAAHPAPAVAVHGTPAARPAARATARPAPAPAAVLPAAFLSGAPARERTEPDPGRGASSAAEPREHVWPVEPAPLAPSIRAGAGGTAGASPPDAAGKGGAPRKGAAAPGPGTALRDRPAVTAAPLLDTATPLPAGPQPAAAPLRIDLSAGPAEPGPRPVEPVPVVDAVPEPTAPGTGVRGWSRTALGQIGLPGRVLAALPDEDPTDDLGWLTALSHAIATCVAAPGVAGPGTPVVVDGHGMCGAVQVLTFGCQGATPGTIASGGRTAAATPLELALAVHRELTGL